MVVEAIQGTAPADDALGDVRRPRVVRDVLQAQVHSVVEGGPERALQRTPRPDVDDGAGSTHATRGKRRVTLGLVLELDEELHQVVRGDSHVPVAEPELLPDGAVDVQRDEPPWRVDGPSDGRRLLPLKHVAVHVK